jgi:hypothetical protein
VAIAGTLCSQVPPPWAVQPSPTQIHIMGLPRSLSDLGDRDEAGSQAWAVPPTGPGNSLLSSQSGASCRKWTSASCSEWEHTSPTGRGSPGPGSGTLPGQTSHTRACQIPFLPASLSQEGAAAMPSADVWTAVCNSCPPLHSPRGLPRIGLALNQMSGQLCLYSSCTHSMTLTPGARDRGSGLPERL